VQVLAAAACGGTCVWEGEGGGGRLRARYRGNVVTKCEIYDPQRGALRHNLNRDLNTVVWGGLEGGRVLQTSPAFTIFALHLQYTV
jgi:hypothetical protein